jgi:tripartite-type tricarboxylate transporter receptor subunit TctC
MNLCGLLAGALASLLLAVNAAAQQTAYPARAVTVLVPFAAGGPTDSVARLIAQAMAKKLGREFIVENAPGAGGTIGARRAARATADGYTLLVHHIGMATAPSLYSDLGFDPVGSFEPIGLIADVPMTLIARKDFPAADLKELIAYLKQHAAEVTYANAGIGAASHLCGLLLMAALQTPLTTVPYKGTGPALNDLLGGHVDLLCDQSTNTTGPIQSGGVRAYGVTTRERVAALAQLPTLAEAGLPGFEVTVWNALYAPHGTPAPIVESLVAALREAIADPTVVRRFAEVGAQPVSAERATPAALREQLSAEIARWQPILAKSGAYAQ